MLNLRLPVVETKSLILRPIAESDADDMYEYAGDPETISWLTFDLHSSVEVSRQIIRDLFLTRVASGLPEAYAMVVKANNKMIGTCDIHRLNEYGSGEIGYVCNKAYRNQGYTTEACKKLIEVAFDYIGLRRLEIMHMVKNQASQRVIQKCGFVYEGTRRSYLPNKDGSFSDTCLYSLLKEEYQRSKTK